jgi:hypothetical protein
MVLPRIAPPPPSGSNCALAIPGACRYLVVPARGAKPVERATTGADVVRAAQQEILAWMAEDVQQLWFFAPGAAPADDAVIVHPGIDGGRAAGDRSVYRFVADGRVGAATLSMASHHADLNGVPTVAGVLAQDAALQRVSRGSFAYLAALAEGIGEGGRIETPDGIVPPPFAGSPAAPRLSVVPPPPSKAGEDAPVVSGGVSAPWTPAQRALAALAGVAAVSAVGYGVYRLVRRR